MTISREAIISALRKRFEAHPDVLAMWLEGADATGSIDTYSDIDLCCSVTAGAMEAVTNHAREGLESLGRLDLVESSARGDDYQYTVFHLEDSSPYLLVDFNVFVGRGSEFIEGDPIEKPLILFDRAGVVRFSMPDRRKAARDRSMRLGELVETTAQFARIEKYLRRGDFLEAFGYYHKWLLSPLVEALRMRYTPHHPDYYIVHISRHLPEDVLRRLEELFKISSLAEMDLKIQAAYAFFQETAAYLKSMEHASPEGSSTLSS